MRKIENKKDWIKVRELGWKWYSKDGEWCVPTIILTLGVGVGILLTLSNVKWQWFFWICLALLYGRNQQMEGYVDGWNQGQEFVTSDLTIDELLNYDQQKKSKS